MRLAQYSMPADNFRKYTGGQKELFLFGADSNLFCSRWDQPLSVSVG